MGRIVAAGPSNSVVIDRQGMYWMAGKVSHLRLYGTRPSLTLPPQWKNTGDGKPSEPEYLPQHADRMIQGSSGSPYSHFRIIQDIMSVSNPRKLAMTLTPY